jgi:hypothetical protein
MASQVVKSGGRKDEVQQHPTSRHPRNAPEAERVEGLSPKTALKLLLADGRDQLLQNVCCQCTAVGIRQRNGQEQFRGRNTTSEQGAAAGSKVIWHYNLPLSCATGQ